MKYRYLITVIGIIALSLCTPVFAADDTSQTFTDRDLSADYDESACTPISLKGETAECSSKSVDISGSTITITGEGTYLISGSLTNGMLIVDADKTAKIQLVLDGADISCDTSAPIYVRQADKVFITLAKDSQNNLSNTSEFIAIDDNNIDAVIFSKDDLTLNGSGALTVQTAYGHGIVSKDDLVITGGVYTITASQHGLSGKDNVKIADGTFTISAGEDGIHASNDDDASLGNIYIKNGDFTVAAADDGMHADNNLTIDGGTVHIEESYEGLEGQSIDINDGTITVTASDDGLNAAGGNDQGTASGGFKMDRFSSDSEAYLSITGGSLTVDASGDGLDSNGSLAISGGEIYVFGPTDSGNGALDYGISGTITGGTVITTSSGGMEQNFGTDSSQGSILVSVSRQAEDTLIELKDKTGSVIASCTSPKGYNSVLISAPEILEGETYTLVCGSEETEITMDSLIYGTSQGNGGRGGKPTDGARGAMGGFEDFEGSEGFERPKGRKSMDGQIPPEMPDTPDGQYVPEMPAAPEITEGQSEKTA